MDTEPELRVLLVDDEEAFRTTLAKVLRGRGLVVFEAATAEEALEVLAGPAVDVVVLDLKMPGIGGLEGLRRISAQGAPPPVVVLTGHGTVDAGLEALRRLAFDFLLKPMPAERLVAVIRAAAEAAGRVRA